jgi:hypothetical protein
MSLLIWLGGFNANNIEAVVVWFVRATEWYVVGHARGETRPVLVLYPVQTWIGLFYIRE